MFQSKQPSSHPSTSRKRRNSSPSNSPKRGRQDLSGLVDQTIRRCQQQIQSYKNAVTKHNNSTSHPLRPLTATFEVSSHTDIMESPTEYSSLKIQQLFPNHAANICHIEPHPSNQDKKNFFIAHFKSMPTFIAAIHDPHSPFFRSNQALDRGGWLPNEHAERMLIINLPGIDISSEEYSQLLHAHVLQTTGVTAKHIHFPRGTTRPRFHAILTLSQPITENLLNQAQSQPFQSTMLQIGGTANPKHYRCTKCNALGHKYQKCNTTTITIHCRRAIYPYQIPKIQRALKADQACKGLPHSSSKKPNSITLTYHNPQTLITTFRTPNALQILEHHKITHIYRLHRNSLCLQCHHPPKAPSYDCPHHQQIPKPPSNSSQTKIQQPATKHSTNKTSKSTTLPTSTENPAEPPTSNPPTNTTQPTNKPPTKSPGDPTPPSSTSPANKTSHHKTTPPPSPQQQQIPEYSTFHPTPIKLKSNYKVLKADLSPSPERPSKPHDLQPPPKTTHIAEGITSYSNVLSSSTLNKLQDLAENPPCPLKAHGKHHTMGFFGKPKHAPALMYTWGNQSVTSNIWRPELDDALEEISPHLPNKSPFNSCLLNVFQTGTNISPRHWDKVQGTNKPDHVVLICLGASRPFLFTNKKNPKKTITIFLNHGDVVDIGTEGNKTWLHERPKCPQVDKPSYSLSFRVTPPQSILS